MSIKDFLLIRAEVATDDADDAYIREETCGDREVRGGATKHLFAFTKGRFDGVERN